MFINPIIEPSYTEYHLGIFFSKKYDYYLLK